MNHLNDNELVLALDGEMEEVELKRAVDHLAECDACRERWEKLQGLSARVAEYSTSLYGSTSSYDVHRLTLVEGPKRFVIPAWGWGLVAAVLVAGSVAFWNASNSTGAHRVAQGQRPSDKDGAQSPVNVATNATPIQTPNIIAQSIRHTARTPKIKKPLPVAQQNEANQYTELPFSNAALPLDQATVVRVTLPAAALRQAGVPVNEDNANAMLQADVVLGMDGLPRGIRLVNNSSGTTN